MKSVGIKTFLYALFVFAFTYLSLILAYRVGSIITAIWGTFLLFLGLFLFWRSMEDLSEYSRNLSGIFSGVFLWGALGEAAEHLDLFSLPGWEMLPLFVAFTFAVLLFGKKRFLPYGNLLALGEFDAIWGLHMMMINQFEYLGRKSITTYPCALLFLILTFHFWKRTSRASSVAHKMAYAISLLLALWTVLEYLWGWRWIPGPWMIHR